MITMVEQARWSGRRRRPGGGRGAGFSFTEVLFAVMVLGIGFIMIAAIFPVAIRQTQTTLEETQAAITAKAALAYLQSVASEDNFPVTGSTAPVKSLADVNAVRAGYYAGRGNFINSINPRLAWVPLYRRGVEADGTTPSPYAEVFLIPVQSRNRSQYYSQAVAASGRKLTDFDVPSGGSYANLDPHSAKVKVVYDGSPTVQAGRLEVTLGSEFAAPGSYVVIADGPAVGRVYQLGAFDNSLGKWTLTPGGDMLPNGDGSTSLDADVTSDTPAYIVGRGLVDPENDPTTVGGPTQETGIYVGFIQIPTAKVAGGS
jgi:type II secretory pathway pseudopilin PulG